MDTKKLRQKILDLAIHGKLVPQDPNDEPASVLLERIRVEKERLISEGKIKRSRKTVKTADMHHYEQDMPFEVPKGWVWTTLGEIGNWQSGATPSRMQKEYYEGTIPWLKTGDLNDGLITEIPEKITEKALEETSVRLNPSGSVLIAMYGATIGKVGILTYPATTNQACCACIDYKINQMFLFYYLLANRETFVSIGGGGAQPNISKEKIVSFPLPLPPLAEQQRIVAEVEHWLALIDTIEQGKTDLQDSIKQVKSKILDLAIHGKLVPQDPSDEPASELLKRINPKAQITCDNGHSRKLPQSWTWVKGKNIFAPMKSTKPTNEKFQYIDIDSIDNKRQIISEVKTIKTVNAPSRANRYTQKNDVVFSMVRPYLRNIAKVTNDNCIASTGFYVCSSIPQILHPDYCYYLMISDNVVNGLNQFMKGDNSPSINKGHIDEWLFPLPPLAEQKRIVQKIEELFSLLDCIEKALQA